MTQVDLRERYRRALEDYLISGGEKPLAEAYEVGRMAITAGAHLFELIDIHQSALLSILENRTDTPPERIVTAAGTFLIETLSPFEMLHLGNKETNAALRRLNELLEAEARRIAHVLHDEAAQMLAVVYLELAELRTTDPGETGGRVERIAGHLDEIRDNLRQLSHELRPPILDQLGLMPALRFLADGVRQRAGLEVSVEGPNRRRWPQPVELALYRAVQEALNNVTRHARAQAVRIRVWTRARCVHCAVTDDGVGFDSAGPDRGLGLVGMRERVGMLHGTVAIDSAPGKGTHIRIQIPLTIE